MPKLSEINPNIVDTLVRTSEIIYEENRFLDEVGEIIFSKTAIIENNKITFTLEDFGGLANVYKSKFILKSIELLTGDKKNVSKINVEDILKMAERKVGNKEIQINKKIKASINKGNLELSLCEK